MHDADRADDERREQRAPTSSRCPSLFSRNHAHEGAHHVLGAVREVDDVEQAEDHREAERQQRVERAVDQPDQQLAEQRLGRDAEDLASCRRSACDQAATALLLDQRAARPRFSGRNACRPGSSRAACSSPTGPSTPPGFFTSNRYMSVDLAAVGADRALAEQRVVGRQSPSSCATTLVPSSVLAASTAFR